jgi:hypothetical protein
MTVKELIAQLIALDADDAHVEVHGHDGSWAWVTEASNLVLHDIEGVTYTVVISVSSTDIRMPTQKIGAPPHPYSGPHQNPYDPPVAPHNPYA